MAITFVGIGTVTNGTGSLSVPMPASIAAGDMLLLWVGSENQPISAPSGWTEIGTVGGIRTGTAGGAPTAAGLQLFAKVAGASEGNVAVADSGNITMAVVAAYRGVQQSTSSGFDSNGITTTTSSSDATPIDAAAYTTHQDGTMLTWAALMGLAKATGVSAWSTVKTYTGFTSDGSATGGGFLTMATAHGVLATAGTVTSPSASLAYTSSSTAAVSMVVGLVPAKLTVAGAATLGVHTGTAAVKNKDAAAAAGVLGVHTGAATVKNKDGAAGAGVLGLHTGAAVITLKQHVAAAGTLGVHSGTGNLLDKDGVAAAGVLGHLTSAAVVVTHMQIAGAGVLGGLLASGDVVLSQLIAGVGTLGSITGSANLLETDDVAAEGVLGSLMAAGAIDVVMQIDAGGILGGIQGAGTITVTLPDGGVAGAGVLGSLESDAVITLSQLIEGVSALGSLTAAATIEVSEPGSTTEPSSTTTEPCYDPSEDRREQILAALRAALNGVYPAQRNDTNMPEELLPIIVVLDSDETAQADTFGRGRPASGPNVITMTPEIYVTASNDTLDDVGTEEATSDFLVRQAVLTDPTLLSLCKDMRFIHSESAVAFGRSIISQQRFEFEFDYVLLPTEPCEPIDCTSGSMYSRERILSTVAYIAAHTEGVASFARNDDTSPDDDSLFPRVIMVDGVEDADPKAFGRGRPPSSPNMIFMHPELYIVLAKDAPDVGPALNRVRLMLLRGILTNTALAGYVIDGDIRYEGCQTAFADGRSMVGEMGMALSMRRVG